MKWKIVTTVLFFSFAGLFSGCYTQVSSGYDDYYNSKPKVYTEQREMKKDRYDDRQYTDTEYSENSSSEVSNDDGTYDEVYYTESVFAPRYRRFFHYYHPSYAFSISFCRTTPLWWYDPWYGWYDPCFPTVVCYPYWGYGSPYYGSWWYHNDFAYGGFNTYSGTRERQRTLARGLGERGGVTGRDLTRLSSIASRERADASISRSRANSGERFRGAVTLRDRTGQTGRERISGGSSGFSTRTGAADRDRSGMRGAGRTDDTRLSTRLRERERESRTENFKNGSARRNRLEDLDPSYNARRQGDKVDASEADRTSSQRDRNPASNGSSSSYDSRRSAPSGSQGSSVRRQGEGSRQSEGRPRQSYSSPRNEGSSRGYSSPSSSGSRQSSPSSSRSGGSSNSGGSSRTRGR